MGANAESVKRRTLPMNLPSNLFHPIDSWSKDDVQQWFEYCIEEYSLGDINLNDFEMNGKALLLLNEDAFKKRSLRSGDVLYKALEQHSSIIKSLTCQSFSYPLWNSVPLSSPSFIRHYNFPIPPTYFHPAFNYKLTNFPDPEQSIRARHLSNSSSSSIAKTDQPNRSTVGNGYETSRQIRYYHDRIDFHGEILMKPMAAKNCRILWEFLYILLEDSQYESVIHWENREKMIFRIVQADKLAALWGLQKNRLSMTYEKLSRGMRYYYSNNIISKEQSKRLLYRFMRSPDEIRKNTKRATDPIPSPQVSNPYLQLLSVLPPRPNFISKSDRSSSSSPHSEDSDKHYSNSSPSNKRKRTSIPISLLDQPLDLAVPKKEHLLNYKKQKLLYTLEQ